MNAAALQRRPQAEQAVGSPADVSVFRAAADDIVVFGRDSPAPSDRLSDISDSWAAPGRSRAGSFATLAHSLMPAHRGNGVFTSDSESIWTHKSELDSLAGFSVIGLDETDADLDADTLFSGSQRSSAHRSSDSLQLMRSIYATSDTGDYTPALRQLGSLPGGSLVSESESGRLASERLTSERLTSDRFPSDRTVSDRIAPGNRTRRRAPRRSAHFVDRHDGDGTAYLQAGVYRKREKLRRMRIMRQSFRLETSDIESILSSDTMTSSMRKRAFAELVLADTPRDAADADSASWHDRLLTTLGLKDAFNEATPATLLGNTTRLLGADLPSEQRPPASLPPHKALSLLFEAHVAAPLFAHASARRDLADNAISEMDFSDPDPVA